jgi:type I restriction enzyme S subunit
MTDRESRADEFTAYKRVARRDVVINRMRAFEGGAGVSSVDGMVSADYAVLRTGRQLDPRFFHHLIRSEWFVGEMTARLRGIGSAELGNVRTPRINVEDLGDIVVTLPPIGEQRAIADYLDSETARSTRFCRVASKY